jgi:predicted nuclease of restriction endonuclease-like (RecB) superfamily
MSEILNINALSTAIQQVHTVLQASAANAVNKSLTIRNWLIGYYIVEYEQNGEDRAEYGSKVIDVLAKKLNHINGIDRRSLFKFRQLYLVYLTLHKPIQVFIRGSFGLMQEKSILAIVGTLSTQLDEKFNFQKVLTLSPLLPENLQTPPEILIAKLSYSHLELLIAIADPLKRTFYEIECIKGTWSVRELKRQIASLYFERSGLSQNPEKLAALVHQKIQPQAPKDIIKNIYAFEFLDLGIQAVVEESDLETALLNHLQYFIIELGNGFCLEARQKRILIGETYYFIDLVFYHRLLKCHVLIDLKIGAFEHGDIGQLNTYLNFFKEEIMEDSDNPPVGILLVAEKDQALVKYATAGMDENLFVKQYMLQLPKLESLKTYLENELKNFKQ